MFNEIIYETNNRPRIISINNHTYNLHMFPVIYFSFFRVENEGYCVNSFKN